MRAALFSTLALGAACFKLSQRERDDVTETYYWPEPRGHPGRYSTSPFEAPRRLTKSNLAWEWYNGNAEQKYERAAHSGLVMDGHQNIFLSSTDAVRKFSSNGTLLWTAPVISWRIPALHNGMAYTTSNWGEVMAIDMDTGKTVMSRKYTKTVGADISGVAVVDGVLVASSRGNLGGGAAAVAGLDLKDGSKLWEFNSSSQLWNFMPMDAGNGTFIFQDQIGGVYRLRAKDGHLLWHSGQKGRWTESFTDGLANVADGLVYAVHSHGPVIHPTQRANLRAYDLETGQEVWRKDFPVPANSQAAVARLGRGAGLSDRLAVVMPIGAQPIPGGLLLSKKPYQSGIIAMDAKTGETIWKFDAPDWKTSYVAGDFQRLKHRTLCLPNPYGSPSVDARGTVFTGHFNGRIYAIRDDNGDGVIQDEEVSAYDTGAGFSHGGAVIAPGTLAIPSCDGLFVFRE